MALLFGNKSIPLRNMFFDFTYSPNVRYVLPNPIKAPSNSFEDNPRSMAFS